MWLAEAVQDVARERAGQQGRGGAGARRRTGEPGKGRSGGGRPPGSPSGPRRSCPAVQSRADAGDRPGDPGIHPELQRPPEALVRGRCSLSRERHREPGCADRPRSPRGSLPDLPGLPAPLMDRPASITLDYPPSSRTESSPSQCRGWSVTVRWEGTSCPEPRGEGAAGSAALLPGLVRPRSPAGSPDGAWCARAPQSSRKVST
jgi:hypothetical protein